jgi:hypothetical protein
MTEGTISPGVPDARQRADIRGMRAIAVLMVVCHHAGLWAPGGFIGVDVFFVLSGCVITRTLLRERNASGRRVSPWRRHPSSSRTHTSCSRPAGTFNRAPS